MNEKLKKTHQKKKVERKVIEGCEEKIKNSENFDELEVKETMAKEKKKLVNKKKKPTRRIIKEETGVWKTNIIIPIRPRKKKSIKRRKTFWDTW